MFKTNQTIYTLTAALAAAAFSLSAHAATSEWDGANGNWSSTGSPGWNGSGIPNAVGAVADHGEMTTATTVQDIAGGITVGTLSLSNNSANYWSITPTSGITLDQDDAGPGFATLTNTNPTVSSTNDLTIGVGTLTLADNLLLSNTGGSTYSSGSIGIGAAITGTGNITAYNPGSNNAAAGEIRFTGTNTFVGNTLIEKGATSFNSGSAFGPAASNTVTLGQSGQGDATLVSTTNLTLPNNVIVAANAGTLILGSTSTSGSAQAYSGTMTLNGNVTLTSATLTATNGLNFTGVVSGAGSITKIGPGILRLANAGNSYAGGTTVSAGTLIAGAAGSLGAGSVTLLASTTLTLSSTVTNAMSTSATLTLNGTATTSAKLNLLAAAGTVQQTVAGLMINGIAQPDGTYGSAASGAADNGTAGITFTDYFTGTGILTVTSVPEPSTYAALAAGLLALGALRFTRARRA